MTADQSDLEPLSWLRYAITNPALDPAVNVNWDHPYVIRTARIAKMLRGISTDWVRKINMADSTTKQQYDWSREFAEAAIAAGINAELPKVTPATLSIKLLALMAQYSANPFAIAPGFDIYTWMALHLTLESVLFP